ncbi:hypothetical protein JCM8547_007906 [Rhodosporidiobolus lusitaniae]
MSPAAGERSYAAATAAWAPDEPQAQPRLAYLDSAQPANLDSLTAEQRAVVTGSPKKEKQELTGFKQERQRDEGKEDKDEAEGGLVGKDSKKPGAPFKATLDGHGAMEEDVKARESLKDKLAEPYMPRANIAATPEAPNGTQADGWAEKHKDESVLQQHVAFFDKDQDGYIGPWDTFKGFHELGYALFWCIIAVFIINPAFSLFTFDSFFCLLRWRIPVKNIHRAKHGSDTGVYDEEGRFVPARFERIFSMFDEDNKGGLTFIEGLKMMHRNRNVLDPIGWTGEFFELLATYLLIWPKDGVMRKEDWRTVYDGSIFFAVADRERQRRAKHGAWYDFVPILPGLFKENRAQTGRGGDSLSPKTRSKMI